MREDNYTLSVLNSKILPGKGKTEADLIRRSLNPNPFNVGDRVGYDPAFLRHAKMTQDSWAWRARGKVDRIDGMLCHIRWDNGPMSAVGVGSLMLERKLKSV